MRVTVVGAGLGGLAAAAHLVGRGHDVTVLERASIPGGRAGLIDEAGFRLDNGPTVLTMPNLLADAFAAAGRDMADYVTVKPVDPMYRAVYADGSVLHVRHGREAMAEEIRGFAGSREADAFHRFCRWLGDLYEIEMANFIDANFDSVLDLLKPWRAGLDLIRLGGFGKLDQKVASFFDDERLRRIFSFQSMYAGLAPKDALALYSVITYMDSVEGVFVTEGGMHEMARGLATALTDAGVAFRYDAPVTRILRTGDGAVTGVEVAGEERVVADAVVCNADLPVAYRTLVGGVEAPRAARRGQYSPSCLLWVAGVRGAPPSDAAHHNIHFGRDWDAAFEAIIKRGVRMPDPSVLVTLHSLDDPTLAPEGCSTIYALEPTPNLDGRLDWARDGERFAGELKKRVGELGYPVDDVVVERVYDPLDWESMGMERGTPFALAHTFRQTGPFRPNNVDRKVPGLVFTGSSTLPGVGVPMVLVSGKLAADRVDEYARETSVVRW
ncbi:MAG: phytoene desaturase family protein [Ilumatobacter sp.]|uniref:phytoene desaturase family protein n=1 Tax=Ilumatobacter sp. TaxID=1967498 RepID=UPI00260807A9|nr:phytoene desaturase family protein [Ilumatobacter sp.]MDJ0769665.1 phytoene desaturase family protein [Ilumatobacter sp.]